LANVLTKSTYRVLSFQEVWSCHDICTGPRPVVEMKVYFWSSSLKSYLTRTFNSNFLIPKA